MEESTGSVVRSAVVAGGGVVSVSAGDEGRAARSDDC